MSKNIVEEKIRSGIEKYCGFDLSKIESFKNDVFSLGVAVSGGADSVCLLLSLCNIFQFTKVQLKVITVNHFIRPEEETCGDVEFVKQLCHQLNEKGFNVSFFVKELEPGLVKKTADERKMGIEEAARFLRYEAFEEFVKSEKLEFLFLAHNKNDSYETILMRFLQGASCDSFSGINAVRGKYVRPLLEVERNEIEEYLNQKNQKWRTDSTNFDTNYLRNKIRNKLMPFLDENFEGWKTAIEKGAKKAERDSDFIDQYLQNISVGFEKNKGAFILADDFFNEARGIQIRILLKMGNLISDNSRIPFVFLNEVCDALEQVYKSNKGNKKYNLVCRKQFSDVNFFLKENYVYAKKIETCISDYCFSDIIEQTGKYEYDWGTLEVRNAEACSDSELFIFELKYKSGKTDTIKEKLPYQLIVTHL